jgi:hypothetical protein
MVAEYGFDTCSSNTNYDEVAGEPTYQGMMDVALDYARRGICVFPLSGKRPRTERGYKDATTNVPTIRKWWATWPTANIGIALAASRLVVVGPDSPDWLSEFEKRGLPPTFVVQTGGGHGHRHYYY